MAKEHHRALVLNADYTPIGLVTWDKAVTLDFKGLVKVVDFYKNDVIRCSGGGMSLLRPRAGRGDFYL